jgi:hypothetical protein
VVEDKTARHGWGDTSLLKEEGYMGQTHPRGAAVQAGGGKRTMHADDLEQDRGMFGVLQVPLPAAVMGGGWLGHGVLLH